MDTSKAAKTYLKPRKQGLSEQEARKLANHAVNNGGWKAKFIRLNKKQKLLSITLILCVLMLSQQDSHILINPKERVDESNGIIARGGNMREARNYYQQGVHLFDIQKYDSVILMMEKYAQKSDLTWSDWLLLGDAYFEQENYEKALETYQNLKDTQPRLYHQAVAKTYLFTGDSLQAIQHIDQALATDEIALPEKYLNDSIWNSLKSKPAFISVQKKYVP